MQASASWTRMGNDLLAPGWCPEWTCGINQSGTEMGVHSPSSHATNRRGVRFLMLGVARDLRDCLGCCLIVRSVRV